MVVFSNFDDTNCIWKSHECHYDKHKHHYLLLILQYYCLNTILQVITMSSARHLKPRWKKVKVSQILPVILLFVTFITSFAWVIASSVYWSPSLLYRSNKIRTFNRSATYMVKNPLIRTEILLGKQSRNNPQTRTSNNISWKSAVITKKGVPRATNTIQNRSTCLQNVTIYMHHISYLRLYSYNRLHDAFNRNQTSIADEVPTTLVFCPSHQCQILLRVSDSEVVLKQSDAIILNLTPPNVHGLAKITEKTGKGIAGRCTNYLLCHGVATKN